MKTPKQWCGRISLVDRLHNRLLEPVIAEIQADAQREFTGLTATFAALKKTPYEFDIYTCDNGYGVKLYTSPEQGSVKICEEFGDDLSLTIHAALSKAANYTKTTGENQ